MTDETTDDQSEYEPDESAFESSFESSVESAFEPGLDVVDDEGIGADAVHDLGDHVIDDVVDDGADELVDSGIHADSDSGPDVGEPDAESRAQAARRIVWAPRTRIAVASLALVAMMFLFVFPTRSYLAQKRQVGRAAHAVEVLEAQNAVLARQAQRLKTPSEIERLAREQFNMVMPGEQAYNVVETPSSPDDTTTTTVP